MVIDAVPSKAGVAAREMTAADFAAVRRGLVLDARILEVTDKGDVRLSTRFGTVEVPLAALRAHVADMSPGTTVPLAASLAADGTLDLRAAAAADEAAEAAEPAPDPAAARQRALAAAVAAAAGRQGGLARLYAELTGLARAAPGTVPEPVRAAAADLLARRLGLDRPPTPRDIERALLRSGLFHEADLAGTGPSARRGMPAGDDLKAALLRLGTALDAWRATAPRTAAGGAGGGGSAPPADGHAAPAAAAAALRAEGQPSAPGTTAAAAGPPAAPTPGTAAPAATSGGIAAAGTTAPSLPPTAASPLGAHATAPTTTGAVGTGQLPGDAGFAADRSGPPAAPADAAARPGAATAMGQGAPPSAALSADAAARAGSAEVVAGPDAASSSAMARAAARPSGAAAADAAARTGPPAGVGQGAAPSSGMAGTSPSAAAASDGAGAARPVAPAGTMGQTAPLSFGMPAAAATGALSSGAADGPGVAGDHPVRAAGSPVGATGLGAGGVAAGLAAGATGIPSGATAGVSADGVAMPSGLGASAANAAAVPPGGAPSSAAAIDPAAAALAARAPAIPAPAADDGAALLAALLVGPAGAGRAEAQALARAMHALVRPGAEAVGAAGAAQGWLAGARPGGRAREAGAPPPRRGGRTHAEAPIAAASERMAPSERAGLLREAVDGALARLLLGQYASIDPAEAAAAPGRGAAADPGGPEWAFEVPVALGGGTGVAAFQIARDAGGRGTREEAGGPVWRVRFSLDLEPFGPVHALLSLHGERLSVGLWAERPEAADRLGREVGLLRDALAAAALEVDEIRLSAGEPPEAHPAAAGQFVDRSA